MGFGAGTSTAPQGEPTHPALALSTDVRLRIAASAMLATKLNMTFILRLH
jgi:hypothetical protein